jgi:hypothetical protein
MSAVPNNNKVLAATVGFVCVWLVLTLSLGETLIALGYPTEAAMLPGNAPLLARVALGSLLVSGDVDMATTIARRAVHASPLAQPALVWLASAPASVSRPPANRAALLLAADAQGWHDEYSQRILYNAAVKAGNCPEALTHAAALLRQDLTVEPLANSLVVAAQRPACQASLLHLVAAGEPWARRWLKLYGGNLDAAQLLPLLDSVKAGDAGVPRDIAAAVLAQLASRGNRSEALAVWGMIAGHDGGAATGTLHWPEAEALNDPTIFDWRLDDGYDVRGDLMVRARDSLGTGVIVRLLTLPQGSYVLRAAPVGKWWWQMSCTEPTSVPVLTLDSANEFTIGQNCPQQWLSLAASAPLDADISQLPPLRIDAAH